MQLWPDNQSVLVVDNCRIHHNDALVDLVHSAGMQSFIVTTSISIILLIVQMLSSSPSECKLFWIRLD